MSENNGIVIKKKHIVIALILLLLLLAGALTVGMNWSRWFSDKPVTPGTSGNGSQMEIDPDAGKWDGQQPEDKGGESVGIKIPGYPSITLTADRKDVTVALLNPEGNPCYFVFELVLRDSGESLQIGTVRSGDHKYFAGKTAVCGRVQRHHKDHHLFHGRSDAHERRECGNCPDREIKETASPRRSANGLSCIYAPS